MSDFRTTREHAEELARNAESGFGMAAAEDRRGNILLARSLRERAEESARAAADAFRALAAEIEPEEVITGLAFIGVIVVLLGFWAATP